MISPWAESDAVEEIRSWLLSKNLSLPFKQSELTSPNTPSLAELREHKRLFSKRPAEPVIANKTDATKEELEQFSKELSTLPSERIRFLYKQRWEVLRLSPAEIPNLADAQYLEAMLRILDERKKRGSD